MNKVTQKQWARGCQTCHRAIGSCSCMWGPWDSRSPALRERGEPWLLTHLGVGEGLLEEGGQPRQEDEEGTRRRQLRADDRPVRGPGSGILAPSTLRLGCLWDLPAPSPWPPKSHAPGPLQCRLTRQKASGRAVSRAPWRAWPGAGLASGHPGPGFGLREQCVQSNSSEDEVTPGPTPDPSPSVGVLLTAPLTNRP